MKKLFRCVIGFLITAPIFFITHTLSILVGKQDAVRIIGPAVTIIAKAMQTFFPPTIKDASEFDQFKRRLKGRQKIWGLLFDYDIEYIDTNMVRLPIRNCPFAEAIFKLKIPELGPYMCRGDWLVAEDNIEKWAFKRNCTIGTGGIVCDFTYCRAKEQNKKA